MGNCMYCAMVSLIVALVLGAIIVGVLYKYTNLI
jgi:hypothetical protein